MSSYEANDIVSLSQGRAYREKIGMYLSADLQEAINLAIRELIVNSQDEYNMYKPKNAFVKIDIDSETHIISVEDNGRGIPVGIRDDGINSLTAALMIAHSGGKHTEGAYSSAIGVHGLGNKLVNHTAEWLEVEVKRDGKIYTQRFESDDEGAHPVTEVLESPGKKNETGTKITYLPDRRVYGDVFIDIDKLIGILTEISYFTMGLNLMLTVDGETETFLSKRGLLDGLDEEERIGVPIHFHHVEEDCEVELALQWVRKKACIRGYANGLYMPDGGAFITGFKTSLTRAFNRLASKNLSGEQIRSVLDGFVSVKVRQGHFTNQSKSALANVEARTATSSAITKAMEEYVSKYPKYFDQVVELLSKVEKADAAAERAREAIFNHEKKERAAKKRKVHMPDKFKDCQLHGQDSLLIIAEGNSAVSALSPARNIKNEAVYGIRGKIINLLRNPFDKCLENPEVSDIILALGCGIQEKYNSKKLNFGKVAVAVDADPDGKNILCLLVVMFYVLMPKFIEEGRLCWLKAPLYRLTKGEKAIFAYTKEELPLLQKKYPGWEQGYNKGLGEMSTQNMKDTMFHPQNRRLEILTIDDVEEAYQTLNILMGDNVEERKKFLFENVDFNVLRMDLEALNDI